MGRVEPIDWKRIDQTLIQAAMLPRRRLGPAIRQIAEDEHIGVHAIRRRMKRMRLTDITHLGPEAAAAWLKHMRDLIAITRNNLALDLMAVDRYSQYMSELRASDMKQYTVVQAARLFQVPPITVLFWANTLKALAKTERGFFTGRELRRFWETEKHLLAASRALQRVELKKEQP
jgi:hypothetical protein